MTEAPIYVSRGLNHHYTVRVRAPGCRTYTLAGQFKSKERALGRLAREMATGKWKRGDVLFWCDWYEPTLQFEMVRR